VADRAAEQGEATAHAIRERGGDALFVPCDVVDAGQVRTLMQTVVDRCGRIDVLVNNAGIPGTQAPAETTPEDDWDRVLAVNLRGVFLGAKYAIPHLRASGRGAIVNIASIFGLIGAHEHPAYSAAKGGVIALTRQLAVDYGPQGIRVNCICPGFIDNDMAARRTRMAPADAARNLAEREATAALQPLGRQATTDEVAAVAVFLASDESSFMTGAILPVDAGLTAYFNRGVR